MKAAAKAQLVTFKTMPRMKGRIFFKLRKISQTVIRNCMRTLTCPLEGLEKLDHSAVYYSLVERSHFRLKKEVSIEKQLAIYKVCGNLELCSLNIIFRNLFNADMR